MKVSSTIKLNMGSSKITKAQRMALEMTAGSSTY